ncbi:MAG: hypothetical protein D6803_04200 [Anaerolineae bacterium]|nr:MAG: hypothetical protein D6803_04200 [Anaerolineae bacterium]
MFILGLLSFVQITYLPGFLALHFFRYRRRVVQTLLFAFALSLVFNHLVVFFVTALGLPITPVFYGLFALEVLMGFWWYRGEGMRPLEEFLRQRKMDAVRYIRSLPWLVPDEDEQRFSRVIRQIVVLIFVLMAASSLWWGIKVWYTNLGTVFTKWDAVVSWNSWAVQWFQGEMPRFTSRYSQLIPTNFAVSYAFLGDTQIQFFAKGFMPLFNVFILLGLFELGLERKRGGYFIGVVATRYILKKFLGEYIASGYVDVALAFFSFAPLYALHKAVYLARREEQRSYLTLGAVFAAGAALTKPNGLLILAVYPLLAYLLVVRKWPDTEPRQQWMTAARLLLLSVVLILPWYAYNQYTLMVGANQSNVAFLMGGRHEGRGLVERFVRAVGLLEEYVWLYLVVILCLAFLEPFFIWVGVLILIPYSLIWALAFSTFVRNLSIALPFLGWLTGMSGERMLDWGEALLARLRIGRVPQWAGVLALAAALLLGGSQLSDDALLAHQRELQKEILLPVINRGLYEYFEELGHFEPVFTDYPIDLLPGMEEMRVPIGNFSDYVFYRWVVEHNPDVRLMLVFTDRADERVLQQIDENLANGSFELIFERDHYLFLRMKR